MQFNNTIYFFYMNIIFWLNNIQIRNQIPSTDFFLSSAIKIANLY